MKPNISRAFSRKNRSPSSTGAVHYGFIADDSLGSAYQAVAEAVLRDDRNAVLSALRVALDGGGQSKEQE